MVEEDGKLRNFVNIFIEGEDVRQKGGMDAEVTDGSDVRIIPSIAGEFDFMTLPFNLLIPNAFNVSFA